MLVLEIDVPSGLESIEMPETSACADWNLPKGPHPEPQMPKRRRPFAW